MSLAWSAIGGWGGGGRSVRRPPIATILSFALCLRWSFDRADLADRLGVSRQTVNALETGRYDPSLPLAFKIARVFDQPIEAIFSEN